MFGVMTLEEQFSNGLLLLLAAFLSGVIGLDRERLQRDAGLRTHILVGMGSCLFTILSHFAFPGSDPARIASQILPGMGFLGAGAILKGRRSIHGLTTAASIWITAAVGMAIGVGAWFIAICATILIWLVLVVIRRIEQHHFPVSPTIPDGDPDANAETDKTA